MERLWKPQYGAILLPALLLMAWLAVMAVAILRSGLVE